MNRLSKFGIREGADEQHVKNTVGFMSPITFQKDAGSLLHVLSPEVMEKVVPNLEDYSGRWNPGGFMVFPLGMHTLGSLRLHIWPKDASRESEKGPSIHTHAWHLASQILRGVYEDVLFDFETFSGPQNDDKGDPLPRLFKSRLNDDGKDILVANNEYVRPIPLKRRACYAGEQHFIPMGIPHLPIIPAGKTTATLVIDSPAFADTTSVLLYPHMEQERDEVSRKRMIVDYSSAVAVKHEVLNT